ALDGQIVLRWRFLISSFFLACREGLGKQGNIPSGETESATTVIPGQALVEPGDDVAGMARS
ncbi:MAG: hypothetical protein QOG66_2426, partial [Methylobacteriaceae bacterium]|nr:hypothetical protein [Methylobacteriaceae bacterium]